MRSSCRCVAPTPTESAFVTKEDEIEGSVVAINFCGSFFSQSRHPKIITFGSIDKLQREQAGRMGLFADIIVAFTLFLNAVTVLNFTVPSSGRLAVWNALLVFRVPIAAWNIIVVFCMMFLFS